MSLHGAGENVKIRAGSLSLHTRLALMGVGRAGAVLIAGYRRVRFLLTSHSRIYDPPICVLTLLKTADVFVPSA